MDLCGFGLLDALMGLNGPSESDGLLCFELGYFFQKTREKTGKKEKKNHFHASRGENARLSHNWISLKFSSLLGTGHSPWPCILSSGPASAESG